MDTATPTGADYGVDDAAEAFIRRMNPPKDDASPSTGRVESDEDETSEDDEDDVEDTTDDEPADEDGEDEEGSEDDADDSDEETDDDAEEGTDPKAKKSKKVILEDGAEAYVKHKVDGKDVEIKVSDLTRLYGQEAALTRKSTEVAEMRKAAEANSLKFVAGAEELLRRAKVRFEPYAKIDWLSLTKDPSIDQQQLSALHQEATKAHEEVQYLEQSLDRVVKDIHAERHADLVKRGQEAWKVLSDPKTGIKGWGEKLYGEIGNYAVTSGLPKEVVNNLVDPAAIKLLHKAMLYDKGKTESAKSSKVNKTPKKIIKEAAEPVVNKVKAKGKKEAEKRLAQTGDFDDAVAAFMGRMAIDD